MIRFRPRLPPLKEGRMGTEGLLFVRALRCHFACEVFCLKKKMTKKEKKRVPPGTVGITAIIGSRRRFGWETAAPCQ